MTLEGAGCPAAPLRKILLPVPEVVSDWRGQRFSFHSEKSSTVIAAGRDFRIAQVRMHSDMGRNLDPGNIV
ncbi:hypothetical protein [Stenotrophomonas phage CM2]